MTSTQFIISLSLVIGASIIRALHTKHKSRKSAIKILGTIKDCVDNNNSGTKTQIANVQKMIL